MNMQLIIGAGGLAKQAIQDLKYLLNNNTTLFFDNTKNSPKEFFGYKVINSYKKINKPFSFLICIGHPKLREYFFLELVKLGGEPASFASKNADIYEDVAKNLPPGNLILSNAIVEASVKIGICCLINKAASIHHDCKIGSYCEIMPGARILGNATIGDRCRIGTNAVILPGVSLCNNVNIGAGAVVTKNIDSPGTYTGVPVK